MLDTLDTIGLKYNTDKASYQQKFDSSTNKLNSKPIPGHSYLGKYEKILPARDTPINFMEIGCCGSGWRNGAGLKTFLEFYRHPESRFWGIDMKNIVSELSGIDNRLSILQKDCSEENFSSSIAPGVLFDVIIEDGSHFWSHQKLACRECLKRLSPGGILIIEDVHTSFMSAERYADGEAVDFVTEVIGSSLELLSRKEHKMKPEFPVLQGISSLDLESITLIASAVAFRKARSVSHVEPGPGSGD